jgi:hypothetical protein
MHSSHMLREGCSGQPGPREHCVRRSPCARDRPGWISAMKSRIRHCVECPKCRTRYLVGFSPYRNGSCLIPVAEGISQEWTLYCSCGRPPSSSRWAWGDLKMYTVSNQAHDRGYGPPEEIVPLGGRSRISHQ